MEKSIINRKTYKNFSAELFTDNQEMLLYDVFHHIQAYILYPLNCGCEGYCFCSQMRENIILSLNMDLYNMIAKRKGETETLYVMRLLLEIPEDSFLKENYGNAYPLWLVEEKIDAQEADVYNSIRQLIWTFLCLARAYEASSNKGPAASLKRALEIILGNTPLKAKGTLKKKRRGYICGEKAYSKRLNQYKSVCYFIAAMDHISANTPSEVKHFLSIAEWIKEKLLSVRTPNIKGEHLFLREDFFHLPAWIKIDNLNLQLDPFWDKLEEIETSGVIGLPKQLKAMLAKPEE
jgi:hypothetical protein